MVADLRFQTIFSDRHFVRCALAGGAPAFVVRLCGRYVAVAGQVFDLHDVHAGVKQERGCCGPNAWPNAFHDLFTSDSLSRSALGSLLKYSFRMVHMVRGSMAVVANSSVWECRRGRKSGPRVSSARWTYPWMACAAM